AGEFLRPAIPGARTRGHDGICTPTPYPSSQGGGGCWQSSAVGPLRGAEKGEAEPIRRCFPGKAGAGPASGGCASRQLPQCVSPPEPLGLGCFVVFGVDFGRSPFRGAWWQRTFPYGLGGENTSATTKIPLLLVGRG